MTFDEFKTYTGKFYWRDAVTYREFCPHEYIIKNWFHGEDYKLFTEALFFIHENGFRCIYGNKPVNIYYAMDEHYYWTLGDPKTESCLNRARIDDYIFYEDLFDLHVRYRRRNEAKQPIEEVAKLFEKYSVVQK